MGVDTGGTFTDLVDADGHMVKLLSTPADPSAAVAAAVGRVGGAGILAHGTTVATNALLERRGAKVALVATRGHADVIEIARQVRPSLYDQWADRPEPLVPRAWRIEVAGRLDAAGRQLTPMGEVHVPAAVDSVAVCLLHADRNPAHEQAVAAALRSAGMDVTCSHEISPEFREYERTVTTVVNAYLRGVLGPYLRRLDRAGRRSPGHDIRRWV